MISVFPSYSGSQQPDFFTVLFNLISDHSVHIVSRLREKGEKIE